MFRSAIVSALIVLGMAACQPIDKNLEAEDSRNPHFKKAESYREAKDYVAATREYEEALRANPNVALAHYELGRLFGEKLDDQISAMYHYSKFIELRPTSENHEEVQSLLQNAQFSMAARLPNSPVANSEMFARLQSENANLKKELEDARARMARLEQQHQAASNAPAAVATPPAPVTPAAPVAPVAPKATATGQSVPVAPVAPTAPVVPAGPVEARSHTIAKGDTLWKIASIYYKGDVVNGIEKIKAANSDKLADGKPLKIGTVLVIP